MRTTFQTRYALWGLILAIGGALMLTGCQGQQPTPTPEPTSTPAPSPPPTGQPFTPVGAPDPRLGLTWISTFYIEDPPPANSGEQDAVRAGAIWDRWPFERSQITREGENFVFVNARINYTEAISRDENAGLNTLAIINGPVPNPSAPDLDDWREYVEAIVTTYGDQVDAWEIGNEDALPHQPGLTPEGYVNILRMTCEVLYEHGQGDKPILLGSPELFTSLFDERGHIEHWREVLRLIQKDEDQRNYGILQDCLKAVGVHIYGRPVFSYDAVVRAHSNASWNPGVWITEHGVMWQDEPADDHPFANKYRQASYVVQQYVLALAGFGEAGIDATDPRRAMNFYHRFADANPNNPNDRYWGMMDWNRSEHYPSYDAISLVTSLLGNTSAPVDMNPALSYKEKSVSHYRFDKDGQSIHVLWAHKDAVRGWRIRAQRTAPGNCATLYYQPGDGTEADGYDGRFWKTQLTLDTSGDFVLDLPASTEPFIGSDSYTPLPMIGGPVYILVETDEPCAPGRFTPPTGSASVICRNGRAVGTGLQGYDPDSGLASLTLSCSPTRTYDLSWTRPGVVYAGMVREVPPPGRTCTLTLTDRDGHSISQSLRDTCRDEGDGGSEPGGDHPDDNHSAADAPPIPSGQFFALPEGARHPARVAILQRGASSDLWWLLAQLGEPADFIGADFDPVATAARYPVLLIPSGGLYGMASPPSQGGAGGATPPFQGGVGGGPLSPPTAPPFGHWSSSICSLFIEPLVI